MTSLQTAQVVKQPCLQLLHCGMSTEEQQVLNYIWHLLCVHREGLWIAYYAYNGLKVMRYIPLTVQGLNSTVCPICLAVQLGCLLKMCVMRLTCTALYVQGKRIIVFVVGGITHSEMRVAHNLTKRLGRDIVIGGTSLDTPRDFLTNLLVWTAGKPCVGSDTIVICIDFHRVICKYSKVFLPISVQESEGLCTQIVSVVCGLMEL